MNYTEIRKGMKVDWQVGKDRVIKDCTVTVEPWMMNNSWVCMIDKKRSCVNCNSLSLPEKD